MEEELEVSASYLPSSMVQRPTKAVSVSLKTDGVSSSGCYIAVLVTQTL